MYLSKMFINRRAEFPWFIIKYLTFVVYGATQDLETRIKLTNYTASISKAA